MRMEGGTKTSATGAQIAGTAAPRTRVVTRALRLTVWAVVAASWVGWADWRPGGSLRSADDPSLGQVLAKSDRDLVEALVGPDALAWASEHLFWRARYYCPEELEELARTISEVGQAFSAEDSALFRAYIQKVTEDHYIGITAELLPEEIILPVVIDLTQARETFRDKCILTSVCGRWGYQSDLAAEAVYDLYLECAALKRQGHYRNHRQCFGDQPTDSIVSTLAECGPRGLELASEIPGAKVPDSLATLRRKTYEKSFDELVEGYRAGPKGRGFHDIRALCMRGGARLPADVRRGIREDIVKRLEQPDGESILNYPRGRYDCGPDIRCGGAKLAKLTKDPYFVSYLEALAENDPFKVTLEDDHGEPIPSRAVYPVRDEARKAIAIIKKANPGT
ncbi:MAG TPA: hypothetical protein HPP77_00650 [Candidatus Hydrogenedentes bacterium]|nr:hypothetical protein [Candidatus Hydrogenedentota bacterium]HIJ72973.1 hypothetical protein [Candidatus Hydrogenedentota bacterium]